MCLSSLQSRSAKTGLAPLRCSADSRESTSSAAALIYSRRFPSRSVFATHWFVTSSLGCSSQRSSETGPCLCSKYRALGSCFGFPLLRALSPVRFSVPFLWVDPCSLTAPARPLRGSSSQTCGFFATFEQCEPSASASMWARFGSTLCWDFIFLKLFAAAFGLIFICSFCWYLQHCTLA